MIKMKKLMEAKFNYNRKFGEPLPTLEDFTKDETNEAINEVEDKAIIRKYQEIEIDFIMGISDIKKMLDKSTGSKTSSRILDKAFGKVSPMLDKLSKLIDNIATKDK